MAPQFCSLITESTDWTSALLRNGGVGFTNVSAHVRRLTSLASTSDVRQKTGVAPFLKVRMLYTAQLAPPILAFDWLASTPFSSARASRPLTRKFSLYLKALARCARPLPVCVRTARGPRRATKKPGLRPQVRLRRGTEFKRGGHECSKAHLGVQRQNPKPGPYRLDLTSSLWERVPRETRAGRVTLHLLLALF